MSRNWLRNGLFFLFGMIILLGLASCSGGIAPVAPVTETEADRVETLAAAPQEDPVTQAPGDAEESAASTLPTATAETTSPEPAAPAETGPEQAPPAPVREGLEGTDPGTVQLASGEVQLVEFFAFW